MKNISISLLFLTLFVSLSYGAIDVAAWSVEAPIRHSKVFVRAWGQDVDGAQVKLMSRSFEFSNLPSNVRARCQIPPILNPLSLEIISVEVEVRASVGSKNFCYVRRFKEECRQFFIIADNEGVSISGWPRKKPRPFQAPFVDR